MDAYLMIVAAATVIFAGVIAYAVARRYGWKPALILPLLALMTSVAMLWQNEAATLQDGFRIATAAVLFSSPALAGALVGVVIARLRGR